MELLIAFLGGLITFISPCVLPMIPVYIAYISGVSVQELKNPDARKPLFRIFLYSLMFVLGFALIFTTLSAIFFIFFQSLGTLKVWFNRVAGALIIIFALHIMGVFTIPFLNREARFNAGARKNSLLSAFIMGLAFGAGWTPCVGPILSGIIATSANSSSIGMALAQLAVYSLGLGLPFILTGILTDRLLSVFTWIKKHYKVIEIVSGVFLVLLGLMLMFNLTDSLSSLFQRLFPALGELEYKIFK